MNTEILLALATRWEDDVVKTQLGITAYEDSTEGKCNESYDRGVRETKNKCIDSLRALVNILG